MTEKTVKEGYQLAEKELKDKQVQEVKKIVLKTLEKLNEKQKEKTTLEEEIRLLRMDIDDLKEGRLDRIQERQEKDAKAKQTSVVIIIKEKEVIREYTPWYQPYKVIWQTPMPSFPIQPFYYADNSGSQKVYMSNHTGGVEMSALSCASSAPIESTCFISNCVAKDFTIGAYEVEGKVVNLR
jgi:hypothetical protein